MRKRKKPMKRFVYLFERKTKRTWKSIFQGKREIKIGIAKDVQERLSTVNGGINGKIVLLASYEVERASTVESRLHKKYKDSNFIIQDAKQNAGGTEFFRLSSSEIRDIKTYLSKLSGGISFVQSLINLFVLILIILFISNQWS